MAQADVTGRRRWKMWCGAAAAVCCIVMAALGRQEAGPVVVACFLALATGTQLLLALFGLLSRYAQVVSTPPVPALRLVVVVNLIGEAVLLLCHTAPLLLLGQVRRWRRRAQPLPSAAADALHEPSGKLGGGGSSGSEDGEAEGVPHASAAADVERPADNVQQDCAAEQSGQSGQSQPSPQRQEQQRWQGSRPAPARSRTSVRPPVPFVRGLSSRFERWEHERPRFGRRLALAAITATFMGCCSLQILAPGFVDVSIVMLTTQWTTLGIALAQALLLRNRLPRAFWPCAAVMLGGAAMVIAPAVSQSAAGSLSTARGWWGFGMAIGALVSTVTYYTLLQACRHMGFTALFLQHCMNVASVLCFLPLTLGVDGTGWGAQFGPWTATDWVALFSLSTVAYMGSGIFMQLCVSRLGAPTASMFFGLRLVFSVVLSTPILGSTIIQKGVQIAGVVITASAVTVYAASQWWASRSEQQQRRQPAEAGEAEGPAAAGSSGKEAAHLEAQAPAQVPACCA